MTFWKCALWATAVKDETLATGSKDGSVTAKYETQFFIILAFELFYLYEYTHIYVISIL